MLCCLSYTSTALPVQSPVIHLHSSTGAVACHTPPQLYRCSRLSYTSPTLPVQPPVIHLFSSSGAVACHTPPQRYRCSRLSYTSPALPGSSTQLKIKPVLYINESTPITQNELIDVDILMLVKKPDDNSHIY